MVYEFFVKIIYRDEEERIIQYRIYSERSWDVEMDVQTRKKVGVPAFEYDKEVHDFFRYLGCILHEDVIDKILIIVPERVRKKEKILSLLPPINLTKKILAKSIVLFPTIRRLKLYKRNSEFFRACFAPPNVDLYELYTLESHFFNLHIYSCWLLLKPKYTPIDLFIEFWRKTAETLKIKPKTSPIVKELLITHEKKVYVIKFPTFDCALCGIAAAAALFFADKIDFFADINIPKIVYLFTESLMEDRKFFESLSFLQKILIKPLITEETQVEKINQFVEQVAELLSTVPPNKRVKLLLSMFALA